MVHEKIEKPALRLEWSTDDLQELFQKVKEVTSKPKRTLAWDKVLREFVPWNDIAFNEHTAEECKAVFLELTDKHYVRHHRTIAEILEDLAKPAESEAPPFIPDPPKRPWSTYMIYSNKYYQTFKQMNPNLDMGPLQKVIAESFRNLSEKKKKKFEAKHQAELERYNKEVEEYIAKYPQMAKLKKELKGHDEDENGEAKPQKEKAPVPPKLPSMYTLYVQDMRSKMKEELGREVSHKEAQERVGKNYQSTMTPEEKKHYEELFLRLKEKYEEEMVEFKEKYPEKAAQMEAKKKPEKEKSKSKGNEKETKKSPPSPTEQEDSDFAPPKPKKSQTVSTKVAEKEGKSKTKRKADEEATSETEVPEKKSKSGKAKEKKENGVKVEEKKKVAKAEDSDDDSELDEPKVQLKKEKVVSKSKSKDSESKTDMKSVLKKKVEELSDKKKQVTKDQKDKTAGKKAAELKQTIAEADSSSDSEPEMIVPVKPAKGKEVEWKYSDSSESEVEETRKLPKVNSKAKQPEPESSSESEDEPVQKSPAKAKGVAKSTEKIGKGKQVAKVQTIVKAKVTTKPAEESSSESKSEAEAETTAKPKIKAVTERTSEASKGKKTVKPTEQPAESSDSESESEAEKPAPPKTKLGPAVKTASQKGKAAQPVEESSDTDSEPEAKTSSKMASSSLKPPGTMKSSAKSKVGVKELQSKLSRKTAKIEQREESVDGSEDNSEFEPPQKKRSEDLNLSLLERKSYEEIMTITRKQLPGIPERAFIGALDVMMDINPSLKTVDQARKKFSKLSEAERKEIIAMYRKEDENYHQKLKQFFRTLEKDKRKTFKILSDLLSSKSQEIHRLHAAEGQSDKEASDEE